MIKKREFDTREYWIDVASCYRGNSQWRAKHQVLRDLETLSAPWWVSTLSRSRRSESTCLFASMVDRYDRERRMKGSDKVPCIIHASLKKGRLLKERRDTLLDVYQIFVGD